MQRYKGGQRRNINDPSILAINHVAAEDTAGTKRTVQVCIKYAVPLGIGNFQGRRTLRGTGAVHENLHATECRTSSIKKFFKRGFICDITRDFDRAPSQ